MYKGKSVSAILLAAGSSSRMGQNKMLLRFGGLTPIQLCIKKFSKICDEIIVTYSKDTLSVAEEASLECNIPVKLVLGGKSRQASVYNALKKSEMQFVAVHDCARCLISEEIIIRSLDSAIMFGSGIASVTVVDTLRNKTTGEIVDRTQLLAAQTPQSFNRIKLTDAYKYVDGEFTDDAAIYHAFGESLHYSEGSRENLKLTTAEDIELFNAILAAQDINCR